MSDNSTKPASEQLAELEKDPEYKAFADYILKETEFYGEIHDVIPDFLYDCVGVCIKGSLRTFGYINVQAIEWGVETCFLTWLASVKIQLRNDPAETIKQAIKEGAALYAKIAELAVALRAIPI